MPTAVIILAAGQGNRMKSERPKVLHKVAGSAMLHHALNTAAAIGADRTIVVTGHRGQAVADAAQSFLEDVEIVHQSEQLGTGHAVGQARDVLAGFQGNVIVLYGDTPLIEPDTLENMQQKCAAGNAVVVLGFKAADPTNYGRLILNAAGGLTAIVEHKAATAEQKAITDCNSGVVCAKSNHLFDLIDKIDKNSVSGEFYLTDIVALANEADQTCAAVFCDQAETMGVDSRKGLARAEAAFQRRARDAAIENGVTLSDPETVYFALDTVIGRDVVIGPNVVFGPGVTIENAAEIRAFCHLEACHVSSDAVVGPFARLRPGAEIAENTHIGNFVEVKNARIAEGAKVNHLSYIGDAEIGAAANIGAGTITCNYDGVMKHRTTIGARAFIGSNTALVAPVSVGADALTGSGSVITDDVPDGALGISRPKQELRQGFAKRYLGRLRALKAKRDKG